MGGSWAEALRRDAAPLPPAGAVHSAAEFQKSATANDDNGPSVQAVPSKGDGAVKNFVYPKQQADAQLKTLVVDTNAIIKGTRLDNVADSLVTITEVFEEIKDKQTRQLLATLPYTIRTREPSDASLKEVVRFARATGDLHSISAPDIKLIALTYTLEAELYGTAHLRKEPPPIAVAKKTQGKIKDPPGWGKAENAADWVGIDEVGDDGKRPGFSSRGASRILGGKALELGDVGTLNEREVAEKPLGEAAEVTGRSGMTIGTGESRVVAENEKAAPSQKPAPWGGFTADLAPANPSESISLGFIEAANSSEIADAAEKKRIEAAQSTEPKPRRAGRGRGYHSKQSSKTVQTKPVAVDGVHAILVEEQAIEHAEGGEGWERNVSRSTRRKHQRRAERAAPAFPGGIEHVASEKGEGAGLEEKESGVESVRGGLAVSEKIEEETLAEKDESGSEGSKECRGEEQPEGTVQEAIGMAARDADLGGQFSDPEEDDVDEEHSAESADGTISTVDAGTEVTISTADEDAEQTNSTADEEEYEYVYQQSEDTPETESVPDSGTRAESKEDWDGASSTIRESESEVACMTSDFAMQNVLLQMGLRLLSVDGLAITQVHRWALRCQACEQVTHEMGRIFCPKCGNGGTLNKVTVMVGEDGALVAGIRKRFSLRGTKYSIPLPKGGRDGKQSDPILREDQLPSRIRHGLGPRKKKGGAVDVFGAEYGPETWFQAASMKGVSHNAVHLRNATAAFNSRKNPNERRVARKK